MKPTLELSLSNGPNQLVTHVLVDEWLKVGRKIRLIDDSRMWLIKAIYPTGLRIDTKPRGWCGWGMYD